jgi:23S rRNA maturation-related 3'-5' exoribonuclease YhaM
MKQEVIKNEIINLLRYTEREGIENLINYMEENEFFTSPCSCQYHLCYPGGLAEHSLNVYTTMLKVGATLVMMNCGNLKPK